MWIVAAGPCSEISEYKPERCPDHADQQALQQKNTPHLAGLHAEAHQDSDVARLFHHHHRERNQNVQRSHNHDERDHDET